MDYQAESGTAVGTALREFFSQENPTASTWIGVSALAAPELLIEIEATAVLDLVFPQETPVSRRLILFAPGAGAPSLHSWMQNWKRRLSEIGEVETFDYDYMRVGRKRPDPLPQLIAAHREALEDVRESRIESVNREEPMNACSGRQKHGRPDWMSRVARGESQRPGLSWLSAVRHGRSD